MKKHYDLNWKLSIMGLQHIHPVVYMLAEFWLTNFPSRQLHQALNLSNIGCSSCCRVCLKNFSHPQVKTFLLWSLQDLVSIIVIKSSLFQPKLIDISVLFEDLGGARSKTNLTSHFSTVERIRELAVVRAARDRRKQLLLPLQFEMNTIIREKQTD